MAELQASDAAVVWPAAVILAIPVSSAAARAQV
jgi:hypothetical protein